MVTPEEDRCTENNTGSLRRANSLRLPAAESELGTQFKRGGSLRIPRTSGSAGRELDDRNRLHVPRIGTSKPTSSPSPSPSSSPAVTPAVTPTVTPMPDKSHAGGGAGVTGVTGDGTPAPIRPPRRAAAVTIDAPAPEYLARNLLQLGCPVVSMPVPRSGVGPDHLQSSDSDDSSTVPNQHQGRGHGHGHGHGQRQMDACNLPKVQVSGPSNALESSSVVNGSAGSIGARSAPSTPLQATPGTPGTPQTGQHSIGGSQLTVAGASPQPPRSPSHAALKTNDSQLSKPLSRSTPSMAAGGVSQTPAKVSRSTSRSSPTSTSSARQKKFHRHFTQVAADERVLNYYSCALVGDILLQGHLYITPNYFAFYSNVFGYVTKLLIPTASVLKISKEKTARIIPNAVAVATEEERHVFCSLLSRDSTFKLMKEVWDAALVPSPSPDALPLPEAKLLAPDALLVDDSEVNPEEDDSSMSESGTDLTSRPPPPICAAADGLAVNVAANISRSSLPPVRPIEPTQTLPQSVSATSKSSIFVSYFMGGLKPGTVITILVALLAALYVSAALMMVRIDRLHTAYLNHPLVSPERFTQDRLLHYLNTNLDQIVKVRQSLQTLSQQFVTISQSSEARPAVSSGMMEPDDTPS